MNKTNDVHELETVEKLVSSKNRATFEEAISATQFGKFNFILILIAIPAGWSTVFDVSTMSYVFPAAQCDLNLSLNDKGMLNAITYIGMIFSGFIWGYISDTLGRRKLLFIGYIVDALIVITSSLSQTFTVLVITKLLGGIIINGPFAALATYFSEIHCAKYRASLQMILGTIFSFATVVLPLMAKLILPADINFTILENLRIHSWNVYLLAASFPPLLGGLGFFLLPESPKFLMSNGRNKEALKVLQQIYSWNTGKPRDTYPITKLVNEKSANQFESLGQLADKKQSTIEKLFGGFSGMKSLFVPPLLRNLLLVCTLQMLFMMSLNCLRLWMPQIFQAINDYEYYNNGTSADLCSMMEVMRPSSSNTSECVVNTNNSQVYVNAMIISSVTVFGTIIAGYLINILGRKTLLFIIGIVGGVSAYSLYFATSTLMTMILSSIYISLTSVGFNVVLGVVVELFPTTLRTEMDTLIPEMMIFLISFLLSTNKYKAVDFQEKLLTAELTQKLTDKINFGINRTGPKTMTVSLTMTVARAGAMTGNLLFPVLLKSGCAAPFFTIGTFVLGSSFLTLLLPKIDMQALT